MKKNSISEFELEKQEFKIRLKRGAMMTSATSEESLSLPAHMPAANSSAPAALPAPSASSGDQEIKSPMIGTFYRSPSPDSAPYVEIGTEVGPDTVVCIIEAMK